MPGLPFARVAPLVLLIAACGQSNKHVDQLAPSAAASPSSPVAAGVSPVVIAVEATSLAGADRLLRAEEPRVRACYEKTPRTPAASGGVAFSIAIDATGVVATVGVTRTGSLPLPVASCIRGLLVDLTFDPPAGGATTIDGRFVFAPGPASQ